MSNPERIDRILKRIKKIWKNQPDLRLLQLLANCFPPGDHYYIDDDCLEEKLKQTYSNYGKQIPPK